MLRSHTCGELRINHVSQEVILCGWVQRIRDKGKLIWIDLRDRYGVTQLMIEESKAPVGLIETIRSCSREYVVKAVGIVRERESKNPQMATGEIEIELKQAEVINPAKIPPFLIEDETDGGDELRMKYRYLDLRRSVVRQNLELRHKVASASRKYLDSLQFIEVETPVLIKSTPEGARDFVVPSRMNPGEFYALPQSPQTFKQLLMVSGFDRYYQIVKCFRDEDLRADRQPEFTQIDCEMSFVEQEDVLETFEGLVKALFKTIKSIDIPKVPRMSYAEAMNKYGSDKPDIRFGMEFFYLKGPSHDFVSGNGFGAFDQSESVIGICIPGGASLTRKQIDELTDFVKKPQIGAKGLVYVRYTSETELKSSIDKFYDENRLREWTRQAQAQPGDMLFILAGDIHSTRKQLSELRLEMGKQMGLRDKDTFRCLWVLDFPLLEWDKESGRFHAMHHPFTSPKPEDESLLLSDPGKVRANAYDFVINGVEVGGGSIRIHERTLQEKMFSLLGFSPEEARKQFGFLMDAFEFGAPPHGGIAFGFDRLCSLFGGAESIRDFIAFPKNNAGRDVMIDTPSNLSAEQLKELHLKVN
jgi:aspartyl-tRNA synthetase